MAHEFSWIPRQQSGTLTFGLTYTPEQFDLVRELSEFDKLFGVLHQSFLQFPTRHELAVET
jgi:hypothetical protein